MFAKIWYVVIYFWINLTDALPPPCPSEIFCHGPLLHTVQMAGIYRDSKTFVDLKLKNNPRTTMARYYEFMEAHDQNPSRSSVANFVKNTFDSVGSEFEDWKPSDWKKKPKFVKKIKDKSFRKWAYYLNGLWKLLGRKLKKEVKEHPDLYSIIWVPNPVIVPGGRFREFYYWDSYWIVKALLLCGMHVTAKGMLDNFAFMVSKYGFVPNGGRIYYTLRSQPPLLIPMFKVYFDVTGDKEYIRQNIHIMDKEFEFWMRKRTRQVEIGDVKYTMAAFREESAGPRPESYREDITSATIFATEYSKIALYSELKAAAESGWDFSSRWFINKGTNKGNLTNLLISSIAPVDLNAIICGNAKLMAEFHQTLGNIPKMEYYQQKAEEWQDAVHKVLWNEKIGIWLDYDIINKKRRNYFYTSNVAPLWTDCYPKSMREHIVQKVLGYVEKLRLQTYPGGIPSSKEPTGEQWDYPNAWAPSMYIIVMGLDQTGSERAQRLAYELAETWVHANFKGYNTTGAMFEKYDAMVPGTFGGGGEYEVQVGFGWTNAIIMDLLYKYREMLSSKEFYNWEAQSQVGEFEVEVSFGTNFSTIPALFAGFID